MADTTFSDGVVVPASVGESDLSLTLTQLRNRCCWRAGYGTAYSSATAAQQALINECIGDGLRIVYSERAWTFLNPTTTLTTVANDYAYDLPADFGTMAPMITYTDDTWSERIRVLDESIIRENRQTFQSASRPSIAAVRPKAMSGSSGQRWELLLWPTPDDAYELEYRYSVIPNLPASGDQYPYGGMHFAQLILTACLWQVELHVLDAPGTYTQQYPNELARAVAIDRRMQPPSLGFNRDESFVRSLRAEDLHAYRPRGLE
jgi:hypothetical protein